MQIEAEYCSLHLLPQCWVHWTWCHYKWTLDAPWPASITQTASYRLFKRISWMVIGKKSGSATSPGLMHTNTHTQTPMHAYTILIVFISIIHNILNITILFVWVFCLHAYLCTTALKNLWRTGQRTAMVPVALELHTVGSCHMDTRNHT